ncbi:MAG: (deoxy)nucleoside triphosphate pyrophosphohydrolase [Candidatus Marinimicrobia bacterium]|nr:(deoxy)nucleoside triphosphate pyrophosphohydrolase [Candidatus Neomarinimicrobiota bacterium]
MLHVVAGIIEIDGYFLLCQRHHNSRRFPLKWEFPGGKVESGETPDEAIKRELNEELGIFVEDLERVDTYSFNYPGEDNFHLYFYRIKAFQNTIQNKQFEAMSWVLPEKILNFDILKGDLPFVKREIEARKIK